MPIRFYYIRLIRYYRNYGLVKTISRIQEIIRHVLFQRIEFVFYIDLTRLQEKNIIIPENVCIEAVESEITHRDMERLANHVGDEIIAHQIKQRFSRNDVLWVIRMDDQLAGYVWSSGRFSISPYYLPLAEDDVFLFDGSVLKDFRGKNIYPMLLNQVFYGLKKRGWSRVIFDAYKWNNAVLRAFSKTPAKKLGAVTNFRILGRDFILWYK